MDINKQINRQHETTDIGPTKTKKKAKLNSQRAQRFTKG